MYQCWAFAAVFLFAGTAFAQNTSTGLPALKEDLAAEIVNRTNADAVVAGAATAYTDAETSRAKKAEADLNTAVTALKPWLVKDAAGTILGELVPATEYGVDPSQYVILYRNGYSWIAYRAVAPEQSLMPFTTAMLLYQNQYCLDSPIPPLIAGVEADGRPNHEIERQYIPNKVYGPFMSAVPQYRVVGSTRKTYAVQSVRYIGQRYGHLEGECVPVLSFQWTGPQAVALPEEEGPPLYLPPLRLSK